MAVTEVQESSEPLQFKTWVLKVSIHCGGCGKKIKRILNSVPGVYTIDIDIKQHRAVVTGNVEADALLRKLLKSGKHAELLLPPEKPPQKESIPEELPPSNKKLDKPTSHSSHSNNGHEQISNAEDLKPPATIKPEKPAQASTKTIQASASGGGTSSSANNIAGETSGTSSGDGDIGGKVADAAGQSTSAGKVVEESKTEGKKPETGSSGSQTSLPVVEVKSGETGNLNAAEKGGVSGNVSKNKKKKGQSGSKPVAAEQSSALPASTESPNDNGGPPPPPTAPANRSPPRHQGYQYPPPYYYAPPVYAVSYNTAQPSSSYTASYYASPAPQSYAYSNPGQQMGPPPPSDLDSYPQQPLDSFEMFSDENPNGCSIM